MVRVRRSNKLKKSSASNSKLSKRIIDSKNANKILKKKEISKSLKSRRSSTRNKNVANLNTELASTSKQTDTLINDKITEIAISEKSVSITSNPIPLQKNAEPQATMGIPSKVSFINVVEAPKTFQSIQTVQSTPFVSNSNVPFVLMKGHYQNAEIQILSVISACSQPVVYQNISTNFPQKDKNQGSYSPILPKDHTNTVLNISNKQPNVRILQNNVQKDLNISIPLLILPNNENVNTVPCIPKENIKNSETLTLQEDQNANTQLNDRDANTQPKEQTVNVQLNDQGAETQSNDQTINVPLQDQSNQSKNQIVNTVPTILIVHEKEQIAEEVLKTKFYPIKPKPSNFQDPSQYVVTPHKLNQKPRPKRQAITSELHKCMICDKGFSTSGTLFLHQRRFHLVRIDTGETYDCRICGKTLADVSSRHKHEERFHPNRIKQKPYYKCPLCHIDFKGKQFIQAHLSNDHSNISLEPQKVTFDSEKEFDAWKTTIERDTDSQFVVRNKNQCKNSRNLVYICHRSSSINCHRHFRGTRKRNMKYKGSIKTGLYCPAFISAIVSEFNTQVTFSLTHLGHDCASEHLPIRKRVTSDQSCKLHRCRVCKKVFSLSSNRKAHEKSAHGLVAKFELTFKCPLCFTVFPLRRKLMHHLSKFHSEVSLQINHLKFASFKEFDTWKCLMEKETNSEYVLDQAYQKLCYNIRRFSCHLSGSGEKELFCPANVLLKLSRKENIVVDVIYTSTHIGHEGENFQVVDKIIPRSILLVSEWLYMKDDHDAAEKILENVNMVQNQENIWTVLLSGKESCAYEVKKLHVDSSHSCNLKCSSCNVCSHQFACNCSKSLLRSVCIHVHVVWLKLKQKPLNETEDSQNLLYIDMSFSEQEHSNSSSESNVLQDSQGSCKLNNLKDQAMSALSVLRDEIRNCNDTKRLKLITNHLSNLWNKICSESSPVEEKTKSPQKRKIINHMNSN